MVDKKFVCDGKEIEDIKYVKDTYIVFKKDNDKYILEGNVAGLKSFLKILNKFLRRYVFILMRDCQLNDGYTCNADSFFDYPSLPLMIQKVKKTNRIYYEEEIMNYPEVKSIHLYLNHSEVRKMKSNILKLINNEFDIIKYEIFDFNNTESKKFMISKKDIQAKRVL